MPTQSCHRLDRSYMCIWLYVRCHYMPYNNIWCVYYMCTWAMTHFILMCIYMLYVGFLIFISRLVKALISTNNIYLPRCLSDSHMPANNLWVIVFALSKIFYRHVWIGLTFIIIIKHAADLPVFILEIGLDHSRIRIIVIIQRKQATWLVYNNWW